MRFRLLLVLMVIDKTRLTEVVQNAGKSLTKQRCLIIETLDANEPPMSAYKLSDDMHYVWISGSQVKETVVDSSELAGMCYEFFRAPNWEATLASGQLLLNAITQAQSEAAAANSAASANAFIQGMQSGQQSKPTFTNCWTDISGMQYCSSY